MVYHFRPKRDGVLSCQFASNGKRFAASSCIPPAAQEVLKTSSVLTLTPVTWHHIGHASNHIFSGLAWAIFPRDNFKQCAWVPFTVSRVFSPIFNLTLQDTSLLCFLVYELIQCHTVSQCSIFRCHEVSLQIWPNPMVHTQATKDGQGKRQRQGVRRVRTLPQPRRGSSWRSVEVVTEASFC